MIFSGLAQCGAWGCFDEFNRLEENILSGISMLIEPLQNAIREQNSFLFFNGEKVITNKDAIQKHLNKPFS